jgi:MinD-like ATPase involved in chromosome partitioning or flagellar assembly
MSGFAAFVRSAPLAVFGSTVARVDELTAFDSVLATPLPLSRRIGFVQARGGTGASATAAYVSNLLARRRPGLVLGVDASPGTAGMLWHAGLATGTEQRDSAVRQSARRALDAVDGLPRLGSGLYALALDPTGASRAPASAATWFDTCSPITRFFDLVVTDWGVRNWQLDLGDVASASHVVCLVARADRYAAEETAELVAAVRSLPDSPAVVVATVDVGASGARAPSRIAAELDVPVVAIPYDGARGAARAVGSAALGTRTRIAYTRLASTLMREATA